MNRNKHFLLICCSLLLIVSNLNRAFAQTFNFGNTEFFSPSLTITDPTGQSSNPNVLSDASVLYDQLNQNTSGNSFGRLKVKEIRSFVKLYIDHANANVYPDYTYQVRYKLRGYTNPNNINAYTDLYDTLTVSYIPDTVYAYQDINMKSYYGFYKIDLEVLSVFDMTCISSSQPCPGTLTDFLSGGSSVFNTMINNFKIEVGFSHQNVDEQIFDGNNWQNVLNTTTQLNISSVPPAGNDNHLHIQWEFVSNNIALPNPVMYELEWTYADDYRITFSQNAFYSSYPMVTSKSKSETYYNFKTNSTRIITDKSFYDIPLVYKSGYIVYRVRPLRPDYDKFKDVVYGAWSNPVDADNIDNLQNNMGSNHFYQITAGGIHLQDKFNWHYESSFAEQGKSKQVVSYFDGLLKNRQTITKFNSLPDQQIVSEQYYNYEGKVGLQTLPIPVSQTALQFVNGFAYPAGTTTYTASQFDNLNPATSLPAINASTPASLYYSSNNVFYNGGASPAWQFLRSLPQDGQYPLIHTQYTADDGRVAIQAGAGPQLQIGTGHETKNYYMAAEQNELNKYFGVNIGKAPFYEKTITKDPNKQLSFSIADNQGKVVMTGLMGDPTNATNPSQLPSAPLLLPDGVPTTPSQQIKTNLLWGIVPKWDGNIRKFNKAYFQEMTGNVGAEFQVALPNFQPCTGYNLNIPLSYKVQMFDEYGSAQNLISPGTIGSVYAGTGTSSCSTSVISTTLTGISDGKKIINYEVSYNPADVKAAVESFITPPALQGPGYVYPTCLKTYNDFLKNALDAVDETCDANDIVQAAPCAEYEQMLKSELYPMTKYGKYSEIQDATYGNYISGEFGGMFAIIGYNNTVSNTTAVTTGNCKTYPSVGLNNGVPYYRYQKYLDDLWAVYNASNTNGNNDAILAAILNLRNRTVESFIQMFDDDVATIMLPMHPEYCKWKNKYCDQTNFVADISAIPTMAIANSMGLGTIWDIIDADPFKNAYSNAASELGVVRMKLGGYNQMVGHALDKLVYIKLFCGGDEECRNDVLNGGFSVMLAVSGMSADLQDKYFKELVKIYVANRMDLISRFTASPSCNSMSSALVYVIDSALIRDAYDYSQTGDVPSALLDQYNPSQTNVFLGYMNGDPATVQSTIQTNINALDEAGFDKYADQIVKDLSNCLKNGQIVNAASLKAALLTSMGNPANQASAKDWKGGLTPDRLKAILQGEQINLDDLCNPYLVDYLQSMKNIKPLKECESDAFYNGLGSMLTRTDIRPGIVNATYTGNSNFTFTIANNTTNAFEQRLLSQFGNTIQVKAHYYSQSSGAGPIGHLTINFYTGSSYVPGNCVTLYLEYTGDADGDFFLNDFADLTHHYFYDSNTGSYEPVYPGVYNQTSPINFEFWCDPNSFSQNGFIPIAGGLRTHIIGENASIEVDCDISFKASLRGFRDLSPGSELHTCLSCLEMKKAFAEFKTTVMADAGQNGYAIKGMGHPFFEDAIRSYFNFYFKKNHSSEEYLQFMQSCNLTDIYTIPQYYGYLYATTGSGITPYSVAATDVVDNFFTTYQSGIYKNYRHFYYYTNSRSHLYVDFEYFPKDKLRQIMKDLVVYVNNNTGGPPANITTPDLNWNKLESEITNSSNFADIFVHYVPGLNDLAPYAATNTNPNAPPAPPTNWLPNLCGVNGCTNNNTVNTNANITIDAPELVTVKDNGILWSYRKLHYNTTSTTPSIPDLSLFTYNYNRTAVPDDKTGYRSFTQYLSHLDADNLDQAKKNYLSYLYDKEQASPYSNNVHDWTYNDKEALVQQLLPAALASGVSGYASYPYVSYYNPDKTGLSGDLFVQKTAGSSLLSTVGNVFYHVSTNASSPFPNNNPALPVFGASETMTVKLVGGNTFWYHLKDNNTKAQRNVYLKLPAYIAPASASQYSIVANSLAIAPAGNPVRRFKVDIQKSGGQPITVYGKTDFDLVNNVIEYENIMLCDNNSSADYDTISTCYERQLAAANDNAYQDYQRYLDSMRDDITRRYLTHIQTNINDALSLTTKQAKYQVTLYEYDRAGNLIATVPPGGIKPIGDIYDPYVNTYRENPSSVPAFYTQYVKPYHEKISSYYYNSVNNLTTQTTPDGGTTQFYYDEAGRLIFSVNANQVAEQKCSYTMYDDQNRIIETGQLVRNGNLSYYMNLLNSMSPVSQSVLRAAIRQCPRQDVIHTFYDNEISDLSLEDGLSRQEFLRNRVATIASYNNLYATQDAGYGYAVALHYSYDLNGNVKTLTYDMPALSDIHQRYKRIDYDYDLYSGKVNLVSYDRGFADQFYQRYSYDDDNRITLVETSKDGLLWDKDATYKYYPHGPLARMELGDLKVQGVDFAYTLQGWLKSMNGDTPSPLYDMGQDGDPASNNVTQTDLARTKLYYFNGDYTPISGGYNGTNSGVPMNQLPDVTTQQSLYNGNISASVSIPGYFPALYTNYTYDQLNRIKKAEYALPQYDIANGQATVLKNFGQAPYTGTALSGATTADLYKTEYTFDFDGNLKKLKRYSFAPTDKYNYTNGGTVYLMDNLDYYYENSTNAFKNNKLYNYTDGANHTTMPFSNDLAYYNPSSPASLVRMKYDKTGNLVADASSDINEIRWNLYNKPSQIAMAANNAKLLDFSYDPLNNRLMKSINDVPGGKYNKEYYIRDASGNILAVYRQQQEYNFANWPVIITPLLGKPAFGGDLGVVAGNDGPFAESIIAGSIELAPSFAANITDLPLGTYIDMSQSLRQNVVYNTEDVINKVMDYDSTILLNALAPYSSDICYPISTVTDTKRREELIGYLAQDEDLTAMQAILDKLGITSVTTLDKESFVSAIKDAIENNPSTFTDNIAAGLEQAVENGSSGAQWYAWSRLLRDNEYRTTSCEALRYGGSVDQTVLYATVMDADPASLGAYYDTRDDAADLLNANSTLTERVTLIYSSSPGNFLTQLQSDGQALNIITGALNAVPKMTPSWLVTALAKWKPGDADYATLPLTEVITKNRFFLAEHHLYGSSRLGIKNYWPGQYLYEWDASLTNQENQDLLNASAFSYRRPWYSWAYRSLIKPAYTDPYNHGNTMALFSERIIGQKHYELTNHLGNVVAVISDKITEHPLSTPASTGVSGKRRATLTSAYDYYPYGMLMQDRYVEDNSQQCTPMTHSGFIKVRVPKEDIVFHTEDEVTRFTPGDGTRAPYKLSSGEGVGYLNPTTEPEGGFGESEPVNPEASILYTDGVDAQKTVEVQTHVTNTGSAHEVIVELEQDSDTGGAPIVLTSYSVGYDEHLTLTAVLRNGNPLRVTYKTLSPGTGFKIGRTIYTVLDVLNTTIVGLECNDRFDFSKDYRFGFNGQEKDNEVKGIGNSLDFKYRMEDARLARFFSIDPLYKDYPELTTYQVASNNPIGMIELEGLEGVPVASDPLWYLQEGFREYFNALLNSVSTEIQQVFSKTEDKSPVQTKYRDYVRTSNTTTLGYYGWDLYNQAAYNKTSDGVYHKVPLPKLQISNATTVQHKVATSQSTPVSTVSVIKTQQKNGSSSKTTSFEVGTKSNSGIPVKATITRTTNSNGTSSSSFRVSAGYDIGNGFIETERTEDNNQETKLGVNSTIQTPSLGGVSFSSETTLQVKTSKKKTR